MLKLVQIKTGKIGKVANYSCNNLDIKPGDICIVAADRGKNFGKAVSAPKIVENLKSEKEIRKVIRKANEHDLKKIQDTAKEESKAYKTCEEKIKKSGLKMKLINVEYTFDKNKIICYFTADGRVDFRELVKDLASTFKIRIELRQIGVRDEAKIINGYGQCGRCLCCSSFCKDFQPVTIRMAKYQRLPLNPSKISGLCGRLMCCLGYEFENYKELCKKMPSEGSEVIIKEGKGTVRDVNVLKQTLVIELDENQSKIDVPLNEIKKIVKIVDPLQDLEESAKKGINLDSDELIETED